MTSCCFLASCEASPLILVAILANLFVSSCSTPIWGNISLASLCLILLGGRLFCTFLSLPPFRRLLFLGSFFLMISSISSSSLASSSWLWRGWSYSVSWFRCSSSIGKSGLLISLWSSEVLPSLESLVFLDFPERCDFTELLAFSLSSDLACCSSWLCC